MLRILRKTKQGKLAGEKSGAFWRIAIAESVLIFLGILIALQVDNWNQDRKDRKLERVLLSEMLANLKSDRLDIEENSKIQQRLLNSNRVALDFLQSDLPWNDSLGFHFSHLMGGTVYDKNTSAYESLMSIGIDLIRNDSLRQKITETYSALNTKIEVSQELVFTHTFDHLYPALRANLRTVKPREITVPVNLNELRQNNGFLEDLNRNIFICEVNVSFNQSGVEDIHRLIADIEQELGLDPGASK